MWKTTWKPKTVSKYLLENNDIFFKIPWNSLNFDFKKMCEPCKCYCVFGLAAIWDLSITLFGDNFQIIFKTFINFKIVKLLIFENGKLISIVTYNGHLQDAASIFIVKISSLASMLFHEKAWCSLIYCCWWKYFFSVSFKKKDSVILTLLLKL